MAQPRVLIVSPTYTHPANQGNSARICAMGKRLQAAGIAVELLIYVLDWAGDESLAEMRACWDAVHLLDAQPFARQSHATCWGIDDWCPDVLVDKVAQLQAEAGYDAVIVNYVWLSKALDGAGSALKILDTHDLFGDRHRLAHRAGVEPNWFFTTIEDENRAFNRADIVLAIQGEEQKSIQIRTRSEVMLVSHPVEPMHRNDHAEAPKAATFGYIGSSNPWNQLSVLQLDAALTGSGVDWLIGGRICNIGLRLKSNPFILGEIEDVGAFYRSVECCFNPMVDATGLKIKTIEALAYDTPVIGTRDAFVGLNATHPFHQCRDAAELVEAAVEVAGSDALRAELRAAGRNVFFRYLLDVDRQYDALIAAITDTITARPTAAA